MKKTITLFLLLGSFLAFSQVQKAEKEQINSSDQYISQVDTLPEFPGGINAFRNYISSRFNSSVMMKITAPAKSETRFLIDTNGNISSVITTGNDEVLNKEMTRVIKSIKTKWKPAAYQGRPVQYWFKLPMSFDS
jgi:protein TonB